MDADTRGDVLFVVGLLIALAFIWAAGGGIEEAQKNPGIFLKPPSPLSSGEVYGNSMFQLSSPINLQSGSGSGRNYFSVSGASGYLPAPNTNRIEEELAKLSHEYGRTITYGTQSPYAGYVTLNLNGARATDAKNEYVTIRLSPASPERVVITGWRLASSVWGAGASIEGGTDLPQPLGPTAKESITLYPGDTAIIATTRSPIGLSFRTNKCSGYFTQFQTFTPSITNRCPLPRDEMYFAEDQSILLEDRCLSITDGLSRCRLLTGTPPKGISPSCEDFLLEELSYSGCVRNHRNDQDFFSAEWRVYLGRDQELWRDRREVIKLLDSYGRTVDVQWY